ncbi:MAG TPA: hypothetical protein VIK99_03155 [Thermaerobacter sp.]
MDERSQGFGQPSFRAERFGQQHGAPAGGQPFAGQAAPYGQHGLASQAGQPFGQGGHAQYGATAQSYDPQQHYTSRWQQPAAQGYQGQQFSGQFSSQFSNQFSNQGHQYGQQAWQGQAAQQFGPSRYESRHEEYGATAPSYDPQQHYSSRWQSYGPQASAGQGAQFGRTGHEQYGATAASYDPQQHYSSRWQPYGEEARQGSSFSNRAQFEQAGQFGQQAFGAQSFGTQAFAGPAGHYGQQGMVSQAGQHFGQAGQPFGQAGYQQYGATARSYNPQEHYSSRWQSRMADEQAGGTFRS